MGYGGGTTEFCDNDDGITVISGGVGLGVFWSSDFGWSFQGFFRDTAHIYIYSCA